MSVVGLVPITAVQQCAQLQENRQLQTVVAVHSIHELWSVYLLSDDLICALHPAV